MQFTAKIRNYGSPARFKPYTVEVRLNGKLLDSKNFHTIGGLNKYLNVKYPGVDKVEDFQREISEAELLKYLDEN